MGLVALKSQFSYLTDLDATAANARHYLWCIGLPTVGYDFRTIVSWSSLVNTVRQYINNVNQEETEPEVEVNTEAEEAPTQVEKEVVKKYKTKSLTWRLVKSIDKINSVKDYKQSKRKISLWLHPDRNKDKMASKYMSIFNNILDIIRSKVF